MASVNATIASISAAETWDQRVARIRLVPQQHGTNEHARIFAEAARAIYVPHLELDFAFVHESEFYESEYFENVYEAAQRLTAGFSHVNESQLASIIRTDPRTLLVFRTITGLVKEEFSHSTKLAGEPEGLPSVSVSKIDSMERRGSRVTDSQAVVIARTLTVIMDGTLFGTPVHPLKLKQDKPDTYDGWNSVRVLATEGVPYSVFLHQRHYGGAFRQVLDATSGKRGDLIEDAVETLFVENGIPHIRTGSHNQSDIAQRFEVQVTPAPDFVVFDQSETLRAMLECKVTNNGGTARDKALRFERLRQESIRLGGIPLVAVLGGIGWARVNDTLGPVVRDTDGRVFTLSTLPEMVTVSPFPSLIGIASTPEL